MSEIVLTPKEFNKMPYKTTTVSKHRTKGDIDGLLYDQGIEKIQWTQLGDQTTLVFAMDVEVMGVERMLAFKFTPPRIYVNKRKTVRGKGRVIVKEHQENTSWRLFYWHLKSKLEAVKYGLASAETELMSNIIHKLPDDSESTVGETMQQIIANGRLDQLALEDRRKAIEAEVIEA